MEHERPRFQTDALGVIVSIAIREHVGNLIIILVSRCLADELLPSAGRAARCNEPLGQHV
jgi:hypothetical protein